MPYCSSRFSSLRLPTREVFVGPVGIGGTHPIRIQSMTTTPTGDVGATVGQAIALAEAGCEIVRITAQNVKAAAALKDIRREFSAAGFTDIPLVADIHFLPAAALEAVEHVEKVRINPGNYADKKKFEVREYSDAQYDEEIERLHEAFSPLVLRARELGRALRIGTNHGSLSDRIMNRYGDTPLGMCESALEFIRIAESHGFRDIVLSMKASNPKVMIQAYRLMVAKMAEEHMAYPLHLGVTEAGDGEDARIKSAIGIGSLLYDGLGDTIRVSLTEDPVYEIPVARALADAAGKLWKEEAARTTPDAVDPFSFRRREIVHVSLAGTNDLGPMEPPRVVQQLALSDPSAGNFIEDATARFASLQRTLGETRVEVLHLSVDDRMLAAHLSTLRSELQALVDTVLWDWTGHGVPAVPSSALRPWDLLAMRVSDSSLPDLPAFLDLSRRHNVYPVMVLETWDLAHVADSLRKFDRAMVFTLAQPVAGTAAHALGQYRMLAELLDSLGLRAPIWIRVPDSLCIEKRQAFSEYLLEVSMLAGALLCDGIGDMISCDAWATRDPAQAVRLAYNVLQGARTRSTKTEFVACPSCGRTLFDLQSTTQRIRQATGHLKGVTIAVMGCIVNGPGEMADADFGYVGGAPGKVNLYVGKNCVRYHIPADQAVEALVDLIREHGKWHEPEAVAQP